MFDVGFSELMVIAVVALIVIGPEKLPGVARTAGHLLGRLQRYVNDVKSDIHREMQLDELKKLQEQVAQEARSVESSVQSQLTNVETSLNESIAGPQEAVAETASPSHGDGTGMGADASDAGAAPLPPIAAADEPVPAESPRGVTPVPAAETAKS